MTPSATRRWRVLAGLLVLVPLLGLAGPQAWGWYHLRAARSALSHYHPEAARQHLERCLKVWPGRASVHLLASRAARQQGDFDEARRQLHACQRLTGSSDEVALEWALLQAAAGDVREVDEFLQRKAEQQPELFELVWEALAEGYIRVYRIRDALACLDHWLELAPNHLRARELRGLAYHNGKAAQRGAEDFRQVIEQDPGRDGTRWRLVLCLLDMGAYQEALEHLEYLDCREPNHPDIQVRLARCYKLLERGEEARRLLDAVLARHPEHGLALRTRGQFALTDRQPAEAERWLRRAAKALPNDYQTHWLLLQSLAQQNKTEQAQEQRQVAEAVKDRAERLGELRSRRLSEQPLDPALHVEMAVLLIRAGNDEQGERWLLSALNLQPEYAPAHAALAELYQRRGDPVRAKEHRQRAAQR